MVFAVYRRSTHSASMCLIVLDWLRQVGLAATTYRVQTNDLMRPRTLVEVLSFCRVVYARVFGQGTLREFSHSWWSSAVRNGN